MVITENLAPDDRPTDPPRGEGLLARTLRTTVIGTIVGFASSVGLYAITGGWGPPDGGALIVLGCVFGILYGVIPIPKGPPT